MITVTRQRQKERAKMQWESLSGLHRPSRGLADTHPVALMCADTLVMIISLHLIFSLSEKCLKLSFFLCKVKGHWLIWINIYTQGILGLEQKLIT